MRYAIITSLGYTRPLIIWTTEFALSSLSLSYFATDSSSWHWVSSKI